MILENYEKAQAKDTDNNCLLHGSINNYLKSLQFQNIINIEHHFTVFFENSWKVGMQDPLVMFVQFYQSDCRSEPGTENWIIFPL